MYVFVSGFYCDEVYIGFVQVVEIGVSGIIVIVNVGDYCIRFGIFCMFFQLLLYFFIDYRLEMGDYIWIWVWAYGRIDDVVCVYGVVDLVLDGFVGGVFECLVVVFCWVDFCFQYVYVGNVGGLLFDVYSIYVDYVGYVYKGVNGSCGYIMLFGFCFSNDMFFI